MIYKQIELAKRCGVTRSTISVNIKRGNLPETLDDTDPRVIEYITKCDVKNSINGTSENQQQNLPKKKRGRPKGPTNKSTDKKQEGTSAGKGHGAGGGRKSYQSYLEDLIKSGDIENGENEISVADVQKAILRKQLAEADKVENEARLKKIQVQKACSELINRSTAEYLYFGYMDKMNRGMLAIIKKIKPLIENEFKSLTRDEKEIEKLNTAIKNTLQRFDDEIEAVLSKIKKDQLNDFEEWEKTHK